MGNSLARRRPLRRIRRVPGGWFSSFRPPLPRLTSCAGLNEDKPYDQFVREQLAGDEINPNDYDHMVATGFLRHGVYEWNQRNARMQWELILNEMTNVTGEVFLGLGMGSPSVTITNSIPFCRKITILCKVSFQRLVARGRKTG